MNVGRNLLLDPMDSIKDVIRARLAELQMPLSEASQKIGRNHAYLSQYFDRGVPRELPEVTRERLEQLLGFNPGDLRQIRNGTKLKSETGFVRIRTIEPSDTIPVLGAVEGGADGWFIGTVKQWSTGHARPSWLQLSTGSGFT